MNRIELKTNHLIKDTHIEEVNGQNANYVCQYLTSLGIKPEDLSAFVDHPRETDEDNPSDLLNMEIACRTAHALLTRGAKVFVVVDSDCDGYTSSSILIAYLKRRYPNIDLQYKLHPGKEHGIVLTDIPEDRELIFVPDAGSNDYGQQQDLVNRGKTVIILDHHEVDNYINTGAILVNNQFSPTFANKYLSGAGIVYMFIKMYDEMYYPFEQCHRDFLDLTAVGIIADAMNMTSLGNNYIAYYGLSHINNQLIHEIAKKRANDIKNIEHLTKIDVAFYIAPIINGVIRSGSDEDKQITFQAMCTENSSERFQSTWRGVQRDETLYENAARLASNAKSRQDTRKKKSFEWLCQKIRAEGLDKDNLIIVPLNEKESENVSPTITGLIAMELVKEFNRPTLVLRSTEFEGHQCFGGSGRNGNFYGLPDLKAFLQQNNGFYQEGHANAFGSFLLPEQIQPMRDAANSQLSAASFETVYEVDYIFQNNYDIDLNMLYQMASHEDLWGNSLPQPRFSFQINYDKTDIIIMGKDRNTLKIKSGQLSFIKFKAGDLIKRIENTPTGTATIVGRAQLNSWQGNVSVQIIIDDMDVTPREKEIRTGTLLDLI